jgi:hypothetical protein
MREFSAGGLVIRDLPGRLHLAVIRVRDEIIALPKGHPQPVETIEDLEYRGEREVAETALSKLGKGR